MPRGDGGGQGMSKPAMIQDVLTEAPDLPAPKVRSAVWERFGGEVTTREIARVRQKLRQARAEPAPPPAAEPARRKKAAPAAIRAKDYTGAEVTVQQLSAILEVATEAGGLKRLRDALATVTLLRGRVGDVDERQLAYALDFLARLTGGKAPAR